MNRTREHYNNYKLFKDVLHRPRQQSLDELRKLKYQEFLEEPLTHIINLPTQLKQYKDAWNIFELMAPMDLLPGDQLLIVPLKPADHLICNFLSVGPPVLNRLQGSKLTVAN